MYDVAVSGSVENRPPFYTASVICSRTYCGFRVSYSSLCGFLRKYTEIIMTVSVARHIFPVYAANIVLTSCPYRLCRRTSLVVCSGRIRSSATYPRPTARLHTPFSVST